MKLPFPTTFITTLLLSAVKASTEYAEKEYSYDADDFKGKFVGTDTVGIHSDHGIEEEGKMKLHFKTVKTHDVGGGTLEGTFFYEGEHDDGDDTEDVVGVWFEDGRFHLIETEQSGTIDGRLYDKGENLWATAVLTEPGSKGEDGLTAAAHRLNKK